MCPPVTRRPMAWTPNFQRQLNRTYCGIWERQALPSSSGALCSPSGALAGPELDQEDLRTRNRESPDVLLLRTWTWPSSPNS